MAACVLPARIFSSAPFWLCSLLPASALRALSRLLRTSGLVAPRWPVEQADDSPTACWGDHAHDRDSASCPRRRRDRERERVGARNRVGAREPRRRSVAEGLVEGREGRSGVDLAVAPGERGRLMIEHARIAEAGADVTGRFVRTNGTSTFT